MMKEPNYILEQEELDNYRWGVCPHCTEEEWRKGYKLIWTNKKTHFWVCETHKLVFGVDGVLSAPDYAWEDDYFEKTIEKYSKYNYTREHCTTLSTSENKQAMKDAADRVQICHRLTVNNNVVTSQLVAGLDAFPDQQVMVCIGYDSKLYGEVNDEQLKELKLIVAEYESQKVIRDFEKDKLAEKFISDDFGISFLEAEEFMGDRQ